MESRKEVRTFIIEYDCDECHEGVMRHTGTCLTVSPPIFPHTCTKCGTVMRFRCQYPKTVMEEVEQQVVFECESDEETS